MVHLLEYRKIDIYIIINNCISFRYAKVHPGGKETEFFLTGVLVWRKRI